MSDLYLKNRTILSLWVPQAEGSFSSFDLKQQAVMTDLLLRNSTSLRPVLRGLLARRMSNQLTLLIGEIEEDVKACID